MNIVKAELAARLNLACNNKSIEELQSVAQEIFDAGFELEEIPVSKITMILAMENLAASRWAPKLSEGKTNEI